PSSGSRSRARASWSARREPSTSRSIRASASMRWTTRSWRSPHEPGNETSPDRLLQDAARAPLGVARAPCHRRRLRRGRGLHRHRGAARGARGGARAREARSAQLPPRPPGDARGDRRGAGDARAPLHALGRALPRARAGLEPGGGAPRRRARPEVGQGRDLWRQQGLPCRPHLRPQPEPRGSTECRAPRATRTEIRREGRRRPARGGVLRVGRLERKEVMKEQLLRLRADLGAAGLAGLAILAAALALNVIVLGPMEARARALKA